MIPIRVKGDPKAYRGEINNLKKRIDTVITKGYIGKRHRVTWEILRDYHDSLPGDLQRKYLKSIGEKGFDDFSSCESSNKDKSDILAPAKMLSDKTVQVLIELRDNIERISEAGVEELRAIIEEYQRKFPLDSNNKIDKKSEVYTVVYKIFVEQTYDKSDFKEAVWMMTNLKVCPYCNRTYIPFISIGDEPEHKSIKGQLDHFYPKENYPYLAVSLYNLVPSCTYCNGPACKYTTDPCDPASMLVSPFSLADHKGLRFRLKNYGKGIFDLDKCAASIELEVDVSGNPSMAANEKVFHITDVYSTHKDIAAEIIAKYRYIGSDAYLEFIKKILNAPDVCISKKDLSLLFWGVPLSEDLLGDRPMSKFTLDLITHLSEETV